MIENLHFIRPVFLLLVFPLIGYITWYLYAKKLASTHYEFINTDLAKHILESPEVKSDYKWLKSALVLISGLIFIISISGPSYEQLPHPVIKSQSSLILLLDLSSSMNSEDIKPSRLERAKQKLSDILSQDDMGQVALIVYAADAYVVTPITDDIKTITTHIPSLSTQTIRKQGSRIDRAINKAIDLFKQTGINQGHVLALTDGIELNNKVKKSINDLKSAGHFFSIIAVATQQGSPIPKKQGGFITDNSGNIVISKLNKRSLKKSASNGNGKFITISLDNSDINSVLNIKTKKNEQKSDVLNADQWNDLGGYLAFLLIPFILLCFRKGALMVLPLVFLIHSEPSKASFLDGLFLNKQQQAVKDYREERYENSIEAWQGNSSDQHYNRGNALAKLGKLEEAISEYEKSIELNKQNEDAIHNLDLVKQMLEQEQQSQNSENGENSEQQDSENNQNSDSQEQQDLNSEQNQENSQSDQDSESDSQQQNSQDSNEQEAESQSGKDEKSDSEQEKAKQDFKEALDENKQEDQQEQEAIQEAIPEELSLEELAEKEKSLQQKIWLDQIQDDPSGLLRRKFEYQDYINKQKQESKQW